MWKCHDGIAAAAGVKDDDSMILVTGATGLSGSAVIRACVNTRLPVRALVRDPAKAAVLSIPDTVEVAEGDMLKPATLDGVLDGVERALMISGPDEHILETQCTFIDAAKRAGVRHIVKLSGMGCWGGAKFRLARMHAEVERYLEGSGVAWTHLRPSTFMQTFLLEVPTILSDGTVNLPMADAKLSPVDVDDIAQVAVALLRGSGHEGKRYEMTGPEALTMNEIAERISSAIDRPVRYVDTDPADYRNTLLAGGIPAYFADAMDELFSERRHGSDESSVDLSTHGVFGVTATTFAEFVRRNADVFRGEATASQLWASGWQPGADPRQPLPNSGGHPDPHIQDSLTKGTAMTVDLNEAARAVLDGPHVATIATSNADGRPQSSVIFVKRDGDTVLFSTITGRLKTRNMLRDPRISLLVRDTNTGRYVEIRGTVDITEDPEKSLLYEMYDRYMGGTTPPPEPEADRLIVRITPEKVYQWPPVPVTA
jgi:PPOX class probable F420-dependent enzyme